MRLLTLLLIFFSLMKYSILHAVENTSNPTFYSNNAVTHDFAPGRLGDQLVSFFHARWIAYLYNLPFFYQSFNLSDQFQLDKLENKLNKSIIFKKVIKTFDQTKISTINNSTLYVIRYFPECQHEMNRGFRKSKPNIKVDWKDPGFLEILKKDLAPINPVTTLDLPKNKVTIAVHVRRGGGFDRENVNKIWPLKFPTDKYYIEQLKKITEIFDDLPLFIHIFTDDQNPENIAKKFETALNKKNIEFSYREKSGPSINILEDFFSIPKFDCLILCQSNFSLMASKLGEYAILVTPMNCIETEKGIEIHEIDVVVDNEKIEKLFQRVNSPEVT